MPKEKNYTDKNKYKEACKDYENFKGKYKYWGVGNVPNDAKWIDGLIFPMIEYDGKESKTELDHIKQNDQEYRK